jgi:hypothetical protein
LNALSEHGFDATAISSNLASSGCRLGKDIQLFGSLEALLEINLAALFGFSYAGSVTFNAAMGLLIDFVERYAVAAKSLFTMITIQYTQIRYITGTLPK